MTLQRDYPVTEHCIGPVTPMPDVPSWVFALDNPYLHGVYAPTLHEVAAEALPVEGELPVDLFGAYFRNGPNPRHPPLNRHHPFDGDGMLHAVYFQDGAASYRNRYVQTAALTQELQDGRSISPGVMGPFDYNLEHRRAVPRRRSDDTVVQRR